MFKESTILDSFVVCLPSIFVTFCSSIAIFFYFNIQTSYSQSIQTTFSPSQLYISMSQSDVDFLSNWRSGNRGATAGGSLADKAKSIFSSAKEAVEDGYDRAYHVLPMTSDDISQEEPSWFHMSRFERYMAFGLFMLGSAVCFILGFLLFPVLTLKPRKFAMLWTLGSLLFVLSFGCLQGPANYCRHLISKERLPFTCVFFGSVLATIYCASILRSTVLTLVTGIVEIFAVLYYTISYFPFGAQGLNMITNAGVHQIGSMVGV